MPRLPSTSWAPSPTRARRTRVFTSVLRDLRARGAPKGTRQAPGRRGGSTRTDGRADAQEVDVPTAHQEEGSRLTHPVMCTRPIGLTGKAAPHSRGAEGVGTDGSPRHRTPDREEHGAHDHGGAEPGGERFGI